MRQTTRDIRRGNQLTVLQRIYADAPLSRQDITDSLPLSPATVANVVTDLLEAGMIVEAGFVPSFGGRPRALLEINASRGSFIGIDVSETYIHFELFDLGLSRRALIEHPVRSDESQPAQIVDHIVDGIQTLIAHADGGYPTFLGIGISVPGLVERTGGVSVFAPNWGWHAVPLAAMLRSHIAIPMYLDNPLKAWATAELWFGAGRGRHNVVTVNLGTGVGAGIITNGAVYRGVTNNAGEWGHTTLVVGGRPCRCGGTGCVESYVGAPGIIQTLREIAPRHALLELNDQTSIIDGLAAAAACGDSDVEAVLRTTAQYLGIGLANLLNLFNPEIVVVGSWVGMRLGSLLLPEVQKVVARHSLKPTFEAASIQLCQLPYNPISMGAATLALEGFLASS